MDEDTIAVLGQFSKELLGDPRFQMLVDLFKQQCAVDMIDTRPEEKDRRDYIHATFMGFSEFTGLMGMFISKYEQMLMQSETTKQKDN